MLYKKSWIVRVKTKKSKGTKYRFARINKKSLTSPSRPHYFVSTQYQQNILANPVQNNYVGLNFQLGNIPNASAITGLFDQYVIDKVIVKIIPAFNATTFNLLTVAGGGTNQASFSGGVCSIHSAIDYDDDTAPTNVQDIQPYNTYKVTRGTSQHVRTIYKPKFLLDGDGSGTANVKMLASKWQDTSQYTVPHYGLKICILNPPMIIAGSGENPPTYGNFDMEVTYMFRCKNTI